MLDGGVCGTIEELARRERVNRSYVSRVLRLPQFAPDVLEVILDGTQRPAVTLARVLEPFIRGWERRRSDFG